MQFRHLSRIALLIALGFSIGISPALLADGDEKSEKKEKQEKKQEKQEKKEKKKKKRKDKKPEAPVDPEMAAWMAANKIQKEHKALQSTVGTWVVEGTFWMAPGAPAQHNKGTSRIRSILGGRFIQETYKVDFMGQPYQGFGIVGYDTMKKKYVSLWLDTMTNSMMRQEGTADDSGDTVTYRGEHPKPDGEGTVKTRMVMKVMGPDTREFTGYELQADGTERKTMILSYKRQPKKKRVPKEKK